MTTQKLFSQNQKLFLANAKCDDEKAQALNILRKSKGNSWKPDEEALKEILIFKKAKDEKASKTQTNVGFFGVSKFSRFLH